MYTEGLLEVLISFCQSNWLFFKKFVYYFFWNLPVICIFVGIIMLFFILKNIIQRKANKTTKTIFLFWPFSSFAICIQYKVILEVVPFLVHFVLLIVGLIFGMMWISNYKK